MPVNPIFTTPSIYQLYADSGFSLAIRRQLLRTLSESLDSSTLVHPVYLLYI